MKYDCRVVISWLLVNAAVVFIFYDQFEEREVLTSTNFKSNFKIVDKIWEWTDCETNYKY